MQLKSQRKNNLEAIKKQENQLKKSRIKKKKKLIKRDAKEEKLGRIVLLRGDLNDVLLDYGEMNSKGE